MKWHSKADTKWFAIGMVSLVAATLVGCGDNLIGPCVHTYREALLQIVEAHDAQDGTPIHQIIVRNVRLDGVAQDLQPLVSGPAYGVEIQGDSLVCHVPCGFSTQEGNYIFTVSAGGYPPQDRGYDARYEVFKGGCPSFNDGGERIILALRKKEGRGP